MPSEEQESAKPISNITIVAPPPTSIPRLPFELVNGTLLPTELVDILNQTYFLHILATDPSKVLPPGKSLLSALSHPSSQSSEEQPTLKGQVEIAVHRAFWHEVYTLSSLCMCLNEYFWQVLQSLSDPTPSVVLSRLKGLYEDLHIALVPLLPPQHPVLVTLSSPISPTSSPLLSAVTHLREVLESLKERCAPARDEYIDSLRQNLEDPPTSRLSQILVDVVRSILNLAELLKEDLSQFVLGSMGEQELEDVIASQAMERERQLVISLWGLPRVKTLWTSWLEQLQSPPSTSSSDTVHYRWVSRLMKALSTNKGVSCDIPSSTIEVSEQYGSQEVTVSDPIPTPDTNPNSLPPTFFFIHPTLLNVQNCLQALVIVASLRSLVPFSPKSSVSQDSPESDLIKRAWSLLRSEIDGEDGGDGLKLVNLADEIIRVRQHVSGTLEPEEETRLRAAVDRTLQPRDPVFLLLHKRLLDSLSERLSSAAPKSAGQGQQAIVPEVLRAGKGAKNPHTKLDGVNWSARGTPRRQREEKPLVVKGFEDPTLIEAATEVLESLRQCIEWTESVWFETLYPAT